MRKFRCDAKPIPLLLAMKLYWDGGSLENVAKIFKVHHTNLLFRFRRFGIPIKTKSEAMRNNPKNKKPRGDKAWNWKGPGYFIDQKGYMVNRQTRERIHREIAEKVLGRPLKTNEVVHHWDKNGQNNEHSNLLISTKSYHSWLEAKLCNGLIGQNYSQGNDLPRTWI